MNLKTFKKLMQKPVFTTAEAYVVAFKDDPKLMKLQLHQWKVKGELIQLKRGVYMFADAKPSIIDVAKALYSPCYFSLEYALNYYGIIPEAVFAHTLVTPKATRTFDTPLGTFYYHTLKRAAFVGYNTETLMAEKEKALVDYFYFNSSKFEPNNAFWEESRLEGAELNFNKVKKFAKLFRSKKLLTLINSFLNYAKSH